ncbi:hypothetical protein scyTo_0010331, partial [Scyliorhinus torazame]|nr:hypothetical protein [Scyliorhinus torazame]
VTFNWLAIGKITVPKQYIEVNIEVKLQQGVDSYMSSPMKKQLPDYKVIVNEPEAARAQDETYSPTFITQAAVEHESSLVSSMSDKLPKEIILPDIMSK